MLRMESGLENDAEEDEVLNQWLHRSIDEWIVDPTPRKIRKYIIPRNQSSKKKDAYAHSHILYALSIVHFSVWFWLFRARSMSLSFLLWMRPLRIAYNPWRNDQTHPRALELIPTHQHHNPKEEKRRVHLFEEEERKKTFVERIQALNMERWWPGQWAVLRSALTAETCRPYKLLFDIRKEMISSRTHRRDSSCLCQMGTLIFISAFP